MEDIAGLAKVMKDTLEEFAEAHNHNTEAINQHVEVLAEHGETIESIVKMVNRHEETLGEFIKWAKINSEGDQTTSEILESLHKKVNAIEDYLSNAQS